HVMLKNQSVPVEYAVAAGLDADTSRAHRERRIIADLIARDARYRDRAEEMAELVLDAKSYALGDKDPAEILELIEQKLAARPLAMLAAVRASNNLFGLSYFDPNATAGERPPAGHVGCATEVVESQALPDGRSNVLTIGLVRYRVAEYVEGGEPYLVARVEFFEDEESDATLLRKRADEVTEMFMRIARAMRAINDERGGLPELPQRSEER